MINVKRTPWKVEPTDRWPGLFDVYDCDGNVVAAGKIEEVARLIEVAPELLEKLADLLNACDKQMFNGGVTSETLAAMEQARAVIIGLMEEDSNE